MTNGTSNYYIAVPILEDAIVEVDEFYLSRVDLGQGAELERDGRDYTLTVSKIYPQVNNGQFEVDLVFAGEEPPGIRRGRGCGQRRLCSR